ncbi:MAG: hypothetical protein ABSF83_15290 [Nitrososphaerales archaeon]|jgi:hypothetical protein
MIVTPILNVVGNHDVTDDIIFCGLLQFGGVQPQLVIRPMPGAKVGAQRLLKIVANVIDTTGSTGATITYNLDNNTEVPLGNFPSFADPTTQAKTGAAGSPNFWQGPIPPAQTASPNFNILLDPIGYIGSFPKATDGGDGAAGGRGADGTQGLNGPIVEIWTTNVIGSLTIDVRGQQGGNGGNGGNGQFGGAGQGGSVAVPGTDTSWTGVPYLVCNQTAGLGGDGGRGGNAGCGGNGGGGGNGGTVRVYYTGGVNLAAFSPMVAGGGGGNGGSPGNPGNGGAAGTPGTNLPPCLPTQQSQNGPNGSPCPGGNETRGGGGALPGTPGASGQYMTLQVSKIPQVSGT